MNFHEIRPLLLSVLLVAGVPAACAQAPESGTDAQLTAAKPSEARVEAPTAVAGKSSADMSAAKGQVQALPDVVVHKSASCGCCTLWVEHMQKAGFTVDVRENDNLNPIKERLGVPLGKGSCHTAEVGGYFIEGHIPADDVKRLLVEKPDARGLVVPGMPLGSPGMEMADGRKQPYTVELVGRDGTATVFAQHGE